MKKKVKIYESEIKRSVRRGIMERLVEDWEMKDTYSRGKYKQSPREEEIEGVFGQYGEEIPPAVLRYMRKNPKAVIKRLYDVYGQQMFDYISQNLSTPDVDIEVADEEIVVDESNVVRVEDPKDIAAARASLQKGDTLVVGDSSKNESRELTEEDDWIQNADIEKGGLSKELGIPEKDNIPMSLIRREINKMKSKDDNPKRKGVQGLSKKDLKKYRQLNLAKNFKQM